MYIFNGSTDDMLIVVLCHQLEEGQQRWLPFLPEGPGTGNPAMVDEYGRAQC